MAYEIELSPDAIDHAATLSAYERATLFDQIAVQLSDQPDTETRNRKQMRENPMAKWELRVGSLRVYYNVLADHKKVRVVAIGRKEGGSVIIGGEVVQL